MRNMIVVTVICIFISSLSACGSSLSSDKAKYSYAIGFNIGNNVKRQGIDLDLSAFETAMKDAMAGTKSRLTDEEIREALAKMQESTSGARTAEAGANLKKGEEFLAANKAKPGVKETKSGLQYRVLKEGTGATPKESSTVVVHYTGKLIDGTEFDSSYKRNQPAEFPLKGVIPGWTEGMQLMKVGSKYELIVPSSLGYGPRGNPSIPGNSVLIFEVELLNIKK
jgi:FKBP-type peptidyl-prolyl cis-trans isomerase FkpA